VAVLTLCRCGCNDYSRLVHGTGSLCSLSTDAARAIVMSIAPWKTTFIGCFVAAQRSKFAGANRGKASAGPTLQEKPLHALHSVKLDPRPSVRWTQSLCDVWRCLFSYSACLRLNFFGVRHCPCRDSKRKLPKLRWRSRDWPAKVMAPSGPWRS
jgi:hypothetical protein